MSVHDEVRSSLIGCFILFVGMCICKLIEIYKIAEMIDGEDFLICISIVITGWALGSIVVLMIRKNTER